MIILHGMKKNYWISHCNDAQYGFDDIKKNGFIHCSTIAYFWRVVHHFNEPNTEYVIICIDTDKVLADIKWEDCESNIGRYYPHIYGVINIDAIINVLPLFIDEEGNFIKNQEFIEYESE